MKRVRIRGCERGAQCAAISFESEDPRPVRGWSCGCGGSRTVEFFDRNADPGWPAEMQFPKEAR